MDEASFCIRPLTAPRKNVAELPAVRLLLELVDRVVDFVAGFCDRLVDLLPGLFRRALLLAARSREQCAHRQCANEGGCFRFHRGLHRTNSAAGFGSACGNGTAVTSSRLLPSRLSSLPAGGFR